MKLIAVGSCRFVILSVLFAILAGPGTAAAQASRGKLWGQVKRSSGEYMMFRRDRSNIPGADFRLLVIGECTYYTEGEEPVTAPNTFSFGGDEFPDLLVQGNRITADVPEVRSDTGHIGTLAVSCRFTNNFNRQGRRVKKANCTVQFDSPVRPGEQLDACIGGTSFERIIPAN